MTKCGKLGHSVQEYQPGHLPGKLTCVTKDEYITLLYHMQQTVEYLEICLFCGACHQFNISHHLTCLEGGNVLPVPRILRFFRM